MTDGVQDLIKKAEEIVAVVDSVKPENADQVSSVLNSIRINLTNIFDTESDEEDGPDWTSLANQSPIAVERRNLSQKITQALHLLHEKRPSHSAPSKYAIKKCVKPINFPSPEEALSECVSAFYNLSNLRLNSTFPPSNAASLPAIKNFLGVVSGFSPKKLSTFLELIPQPVRAAEGLDNIIRVYTDAYTSVCEFVTNTHSETDIIVFAKNLFANFDQRVNFLSSLKRVLELVKKNNQK